MKRSFRKGSEKRKLRDTSDYFFINILIKKAAVKRLFLFLQDLLSKMTYQEMKKTGIFSVYSRTEKRESRNYGSTVKRIVLKCLSKVNTRLSPSRFITANETESATEKS